MLPQLINIALVDDHTLFRKTLASFFIPHPNINVVFEAPDAQELLTRLKTSFVDILLMDIFMPRLNGLEALKIIRREYPEIKVIALSMATDLHLVNELIDAGVYAFISKSDEPENLIHAITAASESRIYKNKWFTEALYWYRQNNMQKGSIKNTITFDEREKKILHLLWEEKSNKEIASEVFLGVRSIEKIRQDLKEKVDVKTTVGLLKFAIKNKIIDIVPLLHVGHTMATK
jgi:DNA-binding NarL/FixJ family response regulator